MNNQQLQKLKKLQQLQQLQQQLQQLATRQLATRQLATAAGHYSWPLQLATTAGYYSWLLQLALQRGGTLLQSLEQHRGLPRPQSARRVLRASACRRRPRRQLTHPVRDAGQRRPRPLRPAEGKDLIHMHHAWLGHALNLHARARARVRKGDDLQTG
jgi:hypothetical protein